MSELKKPLVGWSCRDCSGVFKYGHGDKPNFCPYCRGKNLSMKVGRLAMRREGLWWNAYYALTDTMDGAIPLGSVSMRFVETQERRDAFIGFMREAVSDLIEETSGVRPTWPEGTQPAPEHEKAGHS